MRRLVTARALVLAVVASASAAGAADFTLKKIMKKMGASSSAGDTNAMAPLFARAKELEPRDPDFVGWGAIADRGKAAAEKGDLTGAKATCKECHRQYRNEYKRRYGSKASSSEYRP